MQKQPFDQLSVKKLYNTNTIQAIYERKKLYKICIKKNATRILFIIQLLIYLVVSYSYMGILCTTSRNNKTS